MKSLILIVSILVSAEIQFTLCGAKDDPSNVNTDQYSNNQTNANSIKPISSGQYGKDNTNSVPNGKHQNPPVLGSVRPPATPDGAEKNEQVPQTHVDKMRKNAMANYDNAVKNAEVAYENVITHVKDVKKVSDEERDEALTKVEEQYKKAVSIIGAINKAASRMLLEGETKAKKQYQQTESQAKEKVIKAIDEHDAAYKAADDVFSRKLDQLERSKRKLEAEHEEAIEKAREKRETALEVAEERKQKAQDNFKKAMTRTTEMLPREKVKIVNEYDKEMEKYDGTLEMLYNEWQKVLDAIGIGEKYEKAVEQAVEELEQSQKTADTIFNVVVDEYKTIMEKAHVTLEEATELAEDEYYKMQDVIEDMMEKADNVKHNTMTKALWKWKNIQKQATEELEKAKTEFLDVKKKAEDESKKVLPEVDKMQGKLAQMAQTNTPAKIAKPKFQRNGGPTREQSNAGDSQSAATGD